MAASCQLCCVSKSATKSYQDGPAAAVGEAHSCCTAAGAGPACVNLNSPDRAIRSRHVPGRIHTAVAEESAARSCHCTAAARILAVGDWRLSAFGMSVCHAPLTEHRIAAAGEAGRHSRSAAAGHCSRCCDTAGLDSKTWWNRACVLCRAELVFMRVPVQPSNIRSRAIDTQTTSPACLCRCTRCSRRRCRR